jgi:hypothetical protein
VLQLSTHQEARVAGGHVLQDTLGAQPSTPRRQCNSSHNMVKCVVSTNVPIHAVALSSRCTGRATCPADHAMRRSHPISCFRQGKPRNASCLSNPGWWKLRQAVHTHRHTCLSPMAHCKRIADVHICQCCQLLGKARVILCLSKMEAQVLKETGLSAVVQRWDSYRVAKNQAC